MNQGPIGYEPTALTTELHPRLEAPPVRLPNRCEYSRLGRKLYNEKVPMDIKTQTLEKAKSFATRLNDVGFLGQVLFVILVLLISWSGIKTIQTNYGLQRQITALNQRNDLQKLQNENLKLKNQYYNSNQYLELAARQNFGLAAPGEKEIIVPESVAMSYTTDLPSPVKPIEADAQQPAYQRNFEAWVNFFLHRQNEQ